MHTKKIRYGDSALAGKTSSGAPLSFAGALAPVAPRWLRPWSPSMPSTHVRVSCASHIAVPHKKTYTPTVFIFR